KELLACQRANQQQMRASHLHYAIHETELCEFYGKVSYNQ
ncbi:hypothetical protein AVEN_107684-2-1, partial [Araneus ventricosus]